jgi:tetratricopeptide (TPR) repeat protein
MQYPEGGVEVLNLAVSGYCTRAEVELLKVKGIRYDPDLVILVFVENDFYNFNREALYTDGITGRPWIVNSMYRWSHLFRSSCLQLNLFGFGMEADPARWNQAAMGDDNVSEGFALLRELAVEHEFETLIAVWPAFQDTEIQYNDMMFVTGSREQLIVDRLARMHGLTAVALDQPFREHWKSLQPRPNPRLHYTVDGDTMHPTIEGHRVAASILHELIANRGLLDPSPSLRTISEPVSVDPSAVRAARELGKQKSGYAAVHYNQAKELMRQGKTDQALRAFAELIQSSPNHAADAHNDMGFILFERGDIDGAMGHYRQALQRDSSNYFALVNMGNALRAQGQLNDAIGHYRRAVGLRPEKLEGQYNLGSTLASQGNYAEAAEHFAIAARFSPEEPNVARRLGEVYQRLGQVDQAVGQLRRAVLLAPDAAEGHNSLGLALAEAGRWEEAIAAFREGLRLHPEHAELHFNLGKAYRSHGDLAAAQEHLRIARDLAPSNAAAHNSLGVVLAKMGRVDEAIQSFRRALQLDPNDAHARRNLANARAMRQP